MARDEQRISGWKAIGAHFGRDRTTAIRWANERGLPVHRVPGGKTATVYALRAELDAWLTGQDADGGPTTEENAPDPRRGSFPRAALAFAALVIAAAILLAWFLIPRSTIAMPKDATAARLYVESRDAWAQRTAPSLARSINGLQQVIAREPGFAPAHAALAEAYILSREFGSLGAPAAYPRAKQAAERALALDGSLAEAHRALGFVQYWWERDPPSAGRSFRRALDLDPDAPQTHFWYANILADNGEQAAALREFDAARLGNPGSVPIRTDRAWALWMGGDTAEAVRELNAVLGQNPAVATAHDCLADIALGKGDYQGYVRHLKSREALRTEPGLSAHVQALERALAGGNLADLKRRILDRALEEEDASAFPNHAYAAFVASSAGDRPALLRILRLAAEQDQRWGSAGYVRRIAERWQSDSEILAMLRARGGEKIEPDD